MHSPTRTVHSAHTHTHTPTYTYLHTSAYLSSCRESRGSSRFEHKLRNKTSNPSLLCAAGLRPSTCIELLTARTDDVCDVIETLAVCFPLSDH